MMGLRRKAKGVHFIKYTDEATHSNPPSLSALTLSKDIVPKNNDNKENTQ